jgi:hypothetical protein
MSHQEWLKSSADFSSQGEGTWKSRRVWAPFALEGGIVYHTYSSHVRGVEEFNGLLPYPAGSARCESA